VAYRIPYVDVYTDDVYDDVDTKDPYHKDSFINDGKGEDEFEQIESLCYDEGDYGGVEGLDECSDESSTEHIPGQSDTPPVTATTISANRPPKPFRPQIPHDAERMLINKETERERERDRRQVPPPAQPAAAVMFTPYTPPKPIKPPRSPTATFRIPGARSSTPPLPVRIPAPPPLHSMGDTHGSKRPHSAAAIAVSPEWRSERYSSSPPDPPLSPSPPYPPPPSHTNRTMSVSTAAASSPSHTNRTVSVTNSAPPSSSHTSRTMSVSTAAASSPSHTNRTVSVTNSAPPSSSHTSRTMSVSTAAASSPSHTNRTVSVTNSAPPSSSHTSRTMSVSTAAASSASHTNRTVSVSTAAVPSPTASIASRGEVSVPGPPSDCSEADSEDYQNSTLGTDDVSTCPDLELEFQDEHFFPRHPYGE
jgi:hypothetical protein